MPKLVISGAVLKCGQGLAPSTLMVLPSNRVQGDMKPMATIMDHQPILNVAPFALCRSPANPQVAAATAAAMGVLTPQPCIPVIPAPWTPGADKAEVGPFKALTADSTCQCLWAGVIEVVQAGAEGFTSE